MSTCFDNSFHDIDSQNIMSLRKTIDLEPVVVKRFQPAAKWVRFVSKLIAGSESVNSN
jgi:hypothetical protein